MSDTFNAPDIVFAPGQRNPRLSDDMRAFVQRYDANQKSGRPAERTFVGRRAKKLPLPSQRLQAECLIDAIKVSNYHHVGVAARAKRDGFDSRDPDMADYGRPWSEQKPPDADYAAFSGYMRIRTPAMKRWQRWANRGDRADNGFKGHHFHEDGDRTRNAATGDIGDLMRFAACLPARPKAGPCKDSKMVRMPRRAALYCRYVEQGRWIASFRIDVDDVWDSFDDLWGWLQDLYDAGLIPVMPHVSVSDRNAAGSIERPHLLVFLPPSDHVDRNKKRALGLLKAVARGWIRRLRELGCSADPGGMSNLFRLKCPISPYMRTGIVNAEHHVSLRDMAAFWTANGVSMDKFDCGDADFREDDRTPESNAAWPKVRSRLWSEFGPRERDANTDRYRLWMRPGNRGAMKAAAMAEVMPWAEREFPRMPHDQRYLIVRAACQQFAAKWRDDLRPKKPCDVGVMQREGLIGRGGDPLQKQILAGARTRRLQREASMMTLTAALGALLDRGVTLPEKPGDLWREIEAATPLKRSTIYKWWRPAKAAAEAAHEAMREAVRAAAPAHEPERLTALEYLKKLASEIVVPERPRWSVGKKDNFIPADSGSAFTTNPHDLSLSFDLDAWLDQHGFPALAPPNTGRPVPT